MTDAPIPRLRGVSHALASPAALLFGIWLASQANTLREAIGGLLAGLAYALIFGTSATYHRVRWPNAVWRRRARQADHAMIFIGTAVMYTAAWLIALSGPLANAVLVYIWLGAIALAAVKLWRIDAAKVRHWLIYVIYPLAGFLVVPQLISTAGPWPVALLVIGSAFFFVGGVAWVLGRPIVVQGWFEHHEVFHLSTIAGAGIQLIAMALIITN